jgi:hypothetical protein
LEHPQEQHEKRPDAALTLFEQLGNLMELVQHNAAAIEHVAGATELYQSTLILLKGMKETYQIYGEQVYRNAVAIDQALEEIAGGTLKIGAGTTMDEWLIDQKKRNANFRRQYEAVLARTPEEAA